jgi:hypothetical protein
MALILGVSADKSKKQEEEVQSVLREANYTCACCGIQSKPNTKGEYSLAKRGFMYLVVDDEGKEKVVCTLCYYAMNMDELDVPPTFIYYPWLSQEQINYFLHYIYTVQQLGFVDSFKKQASKCFINLCNYSFHLSKIDPALVHDPALAHQPSKLIQLLIWLKMEEPESYLARKDKYLQGIRLVPFTLPVKAADIKAVYEHAGILLHEEGIADKWQDVYLAHVKTRQQGLIIA